MKNMGKWKNGKMEKTHKTQKTLHRLDFFTK